MDNLSEYVKKQKEKALEENRSPDNFPKELRGFNWGAFILTFIWGIPHKAWITLIAIPLILIQLPMGFNWLLLTAFQIYCGVKGNEWAYKNDYRMTNAQFRTKQTRWGCLSMCISALIPLVFMLICVKFMQKGTENINELLQNTQCVLTEQYLKKNLIKIPFVIDTTSEELASKFASRSKEAISSENSVLYGKLVGLQRINTFVLTFYKDDKKICTLERENCYAEGTFTLPEDLFYFEKCVFYFDSTKKIKPDGFTQKSLYKGMNIFKYL